MTPEEAFIVAKVISTADSRCSSCVGGLTARMQRVAPEHDWEALVKRADELYASMQSEFEAHDFDYAFDPDARFL